MVDLFLLVHPISFLFLDIMPPSRSGLLLAPAGCLLFQALSRSMQGSTLLVLLLSFRLRRSISQSYALLAPSPKGWSVCSLVVWVSVDECSSLLLTIALIPRLVVVGLNRSTDESPVGS